MKKFFSLVLALVMALSLTTVAWGADVANETDLATAVAAGGEIKLTSSFEVQISVNGKDHVFMQRTETVDDHSFELEISFGEDGEAKSYELFNYNQQAMMDSDLIEGFYNMVMDTEPSEFLS